mmetsp:Transcript_17746/g.30191  ORF Transcript_17746/g.30191 Transcript_17746/m.30191 type:complete len:1786 (-) Transcript_17746:225-5582(-)
MVLDAFSSFPFGGSVLASDAFKSLCLVESKDVDKVNDGPYQIFDETTKCGVVIVYRVDFSTLQREILTRLENKRPAQEREGGECHTKQTLRDFIDELLMVESDSWEYGQVIDQDVPVEYPEQLVGMDTSPQGQIVKDEIWSTLRCIYKGIDQAGESGQLVDLLPLKPCKWIHPNWLPLFSIVDKDECIYFVFGTTQHTLESMIKFNYHTLRPAVIPTKRPPRLGEIVISETDASSDDPLRFTVFQILKAIEFLHSRGRWHGELKPANVHVTSDLWVLIEPPILHSTSISDTDAVFDKTITERWRRWEISNLEYLFAINAAAGRRMSDATFHPIIPWVTDFSSENLDDPDAAHWRDLTRSKYRLVKGDHQLDTTFTNSPTPHHITESLSEITYYIYMARTTPLSTLRSVVRSNFEAKEYPASMRRMFEWTPDEAIPEFFTNPDVFNSTHQDIEMPDIELPDWCSSPTEFIKWHRDALESPRVSEHLHHWIDLNFGSGLSGEEAVASKNVTLPLSSLPSHRLRKSPGFVQVFTDKHPPRLPSPPGATSPEIASEIELFETVSFFEGRFSHLLEPVYSNLSQDRREASLVDLQRDDMFAIGCIIAEMFLRQPVATTHRLKILERGDDLMDVIPELAKLPQRAKPLVEQLLGPSCERPTVGVCVGYRPLFPNSFGSVYDFLADFHRTATWAERLQYLEVELPKLLEQESSGELGCIQIVNIVKPSLLKMMRDGDRDTRSKAPILAIRLLGRYLDITQDLLPVVVELYEQIQNREEWDLMGPAIEAEPVLEVLQNVGANHFLRLYLPLIQDTVGNLSAPRRIQTIAYHSLVALSKPDALGPGLAVKMVLSPLVDRWLYVRLASNAKNTLSAHELHFYIKEGNTLDQHSVISLTNKLHAIISSNVKANASTIELILPTHAPSVKAIRHLSLIAGRATVASKVLAMSFRVLHKVWEPASPGKSLSIILDVLSVLACFLQLLTPDDVHEWFLKKKPSSPPLLHELLAEIVSHPEQPTLLKLYLAVVVALACSRAGQYQIAPVLGVMKRVFEFAEANGDSGDGLWIARVVFLPFQLFWGSDRIKSIYPILATGTFIKQLEYPYDLAISTPVTNATIGDIGSASPRLFRSSSSNSMLVSDELEMQPTSAATMSPRNLLVDEDEDEEDEFDEGDINVLLEGEVVHNTKADTPRTPKKEPPPQIQTQFSKDFGGVPESRQDVKNIVSPVSGNDDFEVKEYDIGKRVNHVAEQTWIVGYSPSKREEGFDGRIVNTFQGHDAPIVTMEVDESERFLVTSGRDNNVRFWSLAGIPTPVTSIKNVRPVSGVKMFDRGRKCILLDGAIRLWDIEAQASTLSTIPVGVHHRPILTIERSPLGHGSESVFWGATVAGTLDCLDFRVPGTFVASHKLPYSTSSLSNDYDPKGFTCSSLAVGGDHTGGWVAASRPSGYITVIDPRSGAVFAHWKGHESSVVSVNSLSLQNTTSLQSNRRDSVGSTTTPWEQQPEHLPQIRDGKCNQLLSISGDGTARVWDVSMQGGFENSHNSPWLGTRRPLCRIRITGLPSACRFSRVLAPHHQGGYQRWTQGNKHSVVENTDETGDSNMIAPGMQDDETNSTVSPGPVNHHQRADESQVRRLPLTDPPTPPVGTQAKEISNSAQTNGLSRIPSVTTLPPFIEPTTSMPGNTFTAPGMSRKPAPAGKGRRIYISIPQCDTATLWRDSHVVDGGSNLVMGTANKISMVKLNLRSRATEVNAKPISLVDRSNQPIPPEKLKINVIRALPMRGLVLLGSESGCIHAVD